MFNIKVMTLAGVWWIHSRYDGYTYDQKRSGAAEFSQDEIFDVRRFVRSALKNARVEAVPVSGQVIPFLPHTRTVKAHCDA